MKAGFFLFVTGWNPAFLLFEAAGFWPFLMGKKRGNMPYYLHNLLFTEVCAFLIYNEVTL
ncbi:hypothetical protein SAMD00020551_4391 [Mesobacillus selenatarsenatis SF-1]|uniref:Uncharacterized protein n=1 Tax=Mesobacillus selenatarsenatis (strain DSM 18680 / JCM 14380 / FERM P-15431 / SF-1) TaxID=1321606 RepID=A0A0A8X8E8_MESS1|nr:hypothetical protein SAMD00020551_4391 [Mesobacillus selenatarsenatis SF-1]